MQKIFKIILFFVLTSTAMQAQAWQEPEEKHSIYVSSISWHTGIVVPVDIFPEDIWPEKQKYSDAAYLEIGWGDADYFPSRSFNPWYALKAIVWPTSSVIQIKPIYGKVEAFYPNTNVAEIDISKEQMQNLRKYLLGEFELGHNGKIIPVTAGPSGSYFYKGSSSYYFPKNSNVWAAKALKEAGFSINPIWYQTTGQVVRKAGKFGEMILEKD
jgi:uncharacterized protein (TIGR02117 family)